MNQRMVVDRQLDQQQQIAEMRAGRRAGALLDNDDEDMDEQEMNAMRRRRMREMREGDDDGMDMMNQDHDDL